jgi:hypothetical protein
VRRRHFDLGWNVNIMIQFFFCIFLTAVHYIVPRQKKKVSYFIFVSAVKLRRSGELFYCSS